MIKTIRKLLLASLVIAACLPAETPNVVFVITDDQGYGDLSSTGNPILQTPEIDRLHAESIRLTDFHVSPTCAPTRGALMSGHYTNRAGPWHTIKGRSMLRLTSLTWGEVFSAAGYATGMFGKWHLGDNYPFRAIDRGFTEVVSHGAGGVGQTPDHWDNAYFDDTYDHNGVPQKFEGYCTDVFFNEAKRFIKASAAQDQPFLAYISTNAPHSPFHCPEEFVEPYRNQGLSEREAIFFGMIANIDWNVGKLIDFLEEEGLAENTILIFTTDNGTATGGQVFNAGMRGFKNSPYDGGHRVPFLVRWPAGGLGGGEDVDVLSAHIDVLPTFVDLCGLTLPPNYILDGRSLVPLLYDLPTVWPDRTIVTDSQRVTDPIKWRNSATMTQDWRLINGEELYHMGTDPGQQDDIAAEHPDVVAKLRADYETWWAAIEPTFAEETRIMVGNPGENPSFLTSHDWITDEEFTPWNQGHIRRGKMGEGYWNLEVDQAGTYEIELSRWPLHLGVPLTAGLAPGAPVPGLESFRDPAGKALPIWAAMIQMGDVKLEKATEAGASSVTFTVELAPGPMQLEATFLLEGEPNRVGAYYARIQRY